MVGGSLVFTVILLRYSSRKMLNPTATKQMLCELNQSARTAFGYLVFVNKSLFVSILSSIKDLAFIAISKYILKLSLKASLVEYKKSIANPKFKGDDLL